VTTVVETPYSRWIVGRAGSTIVCSRAKERPETARTASVIP
jgi:hypothetical protein